jgi:hypothetical protein
MTTGSEGALLRAAARVGRTLGTWRRRRVEAKQDALVDAWKLAWTDGCNRRWQGASRDEAPYRPGTQRDAWHAGWQWADSHPDRRDPNRASRGGDRRRADVDGRFARAAKRGAAGLTLLAAARWLWRRRTPDRPGQTSSG